MESENTEQTTQFEQLCKVTPLSKYLAMILFISMPFLGGWIGYMYSPDKSIETEVNPADSIKKEVVEAKLDLENIFNLKDKEPGTEVFYSEKQGVGFSYLPLYNNDFQLVEIEDSIFYVDRNVSSEMIEIFSKDPKVSLEDTIYNKFVSEAGLNIADCEVVISESHSSDKNNKRASLHSPDLVSYLDGPIQCVSDYTTDSSFQYFLYNEEVPDKYIFVRLGQDTFATDGTPENVARTSWEYSIQILE